MEKSSPKPVLFLLVLAGLAQPFSAVSADLAIGPEDLRIEQRVDGGYHLFVRRKGDVRSVLLTESTRDPSGKADNYAYRSAAWNPVNGDEVRLLDGAPIPKERGIWSLIDSSVESDAAFGEAFHIYIPYLVLYGYAWTRNGETYVVDGTYLNIRAFEKPFGDYAGGFKDNPFVLKVIQKPLEGPPEGNFMKDTVDAFTEIAKKGETVRSTGADDLVPKIKNLLEDARGKSVDLVLALDTTSSMKDDIDSVRKMLIPMLQELISGFRSFRIGMVLYKDYFDEYVTKIVPYTSDFGAFQRNLNAIRVAGGRDIPEAVHEALYAAATKFAWEAEARKIILIGDAPPHLRPMGDVTARMVDEAAAERGLEVDTIILPQ